MLKVLARAYLGLITVVVVVFIILTEKNMLNNQAYLWIIL